MQIDFLKINDLYGDEMLKSFKENIETVIENLNYLVKLGFDNYEEIVERYAPILLLSSNEFKNKLNDLILKLGPDYLDKFETDMSLWENLL